MIWADTAKQFLGAICSKDITIMEGLFADDIEFRSWGCSVKGKEKALKVNESHISLVNETKIKIHNTAYKDKYICIECDLSHSYKLNIVDVFDTANVKPENSIISISLVYVIEFNDMGKIKSIKSYKLK